jgi:NAD-dependent dihydropyrimidine dehydrogenase PreA subunit
MLGRLRQRVPDLLRRVAWQASNLAWTGQWQAVRAAATPWMRQEYEAARAKLRADPRAGLVVDRDALDGWMRDAAPPGVPFESVVLRGSELRARFPDGPTERRSLHLLGKLRMTHRAIPSETVVVTALYSDVAADYFVESMAADVAAAVNERYGAGVALADAEASVPVVLKEVATAAGLGTIGKNALFFSRRFGFNCKLSVVFLNAPASRYDATPQASEWKLPDCATCNLCVEACPVGAFDDYQITNVAACDRFISADYFGARRDHMCRACITRCPVSNDVLKLRRREGAPQRTFWDNEAQLALVADLFTYRPSFWVWLMQRFYYGADLPGRDAHKKKGLAEALASSSSVARTDRTRDGWRLAARKRPR